MNAPPPAVEILPEERACDLLANMLDAIDRGHWRRAEDIWDELKPLCSSIFQFHAARRGGA